MEKAHDRSSWDSLWRPMFRKEESSALQMMILSVYVLQKVTIVHNCHIIVFPLMLPNIFNFQVCFFVKKQTFFLDVSFSLLESLLYLIQI